MTVNQFYIPIVITLIAFPLLIVRIVKHRDLVHENFILVAISLTGLFYFNYVRVRSDIMHLIPTLPIYLILFGFLISRLYENVYFHQHKYLRKTIAILVFTFMACFLIKNIDKYTKNTYRKPMKGKIKLVNFELGNVYIPVRDAHFVKQVVSFIRDNSADNEKIFVGNISHIDVGGTDIIIYFLSGRLPCTKYYQFHPQVTDQTEIQKEIIKSIEKDVNLIVLVDNSKGKKAYASQSDIPLDNYIKENFILAKNIGHYYIYRKKK